MWLFVDFAPNLPELNLVMFETILDSAQVNSGQNTEIKKQSNDKFLLNWIKYGAVSYSISCTFLVWRGKNRSGRAVESIYSYQLCVQYKSGTLLLNEGILRAYRGKKLRLKNILFFPSKSEGITCRFWWKYLQKVNADRPQICDEK